MKHLKANQFFGQPNKIFRLEEITLTDAKYTFDRVDWHLHFISKHSFVAI